MKTDLYTKVVLTVIAMCLGVIVLREIELVPRAEAAPSQGGVVDVRLVAIEPDTHVHWKPIAVTIQK